MENNMVMRMVNFDDMASVRNIVSEGQARIKALKEIGLLNMLNAMISEPEKLFTMAELSAASKVNLSTRDINSVMWSLVEATSNKKEGNPLWYKYRDTTGQGNFHSTWIKENRNRIPALQTYLEKNPNGVVSLQRMRGEPIITEFVLLNKDGSVNLNRKIRRKTNTYCWGIKVSH